jgi:hypothetical protein
MPVENRVMITNVGPGECIPLIFDLTVAFQNSTVPDGKTGAGCGAAGAPADKNAPPGNGTHTFRLTHAATGSNHTISAALKNGAGVQVTGCTVGSIGIGNPCPIVFNPDGGPIGGLPGLIPNANVSGTFDSEKGNGVFLLMEEPARLVDGVEHQPRLIFAGVAEVKVTAGQKKGEWKHPAIPGAQPGYHVRALLTKDGAVKAIARAAYK